MNLDTIAKIFTTEEIVKAFCSPFDRLQKLLDSGEEEIYNFIYDNREKCCEFSFALTSAIMHPACPENILRAVFEERNMLYFYSVAANPNCPEDILREMAFGKFYLSDRTYEAIYLNPNCSFKKELLDKHHAAITLREGILYD